MCDDDCRNAYVATSLLDRTCINSIVSVDLYLFLLVFFLMHRISSCVIMRLRFSVLSPLCAFGHVSIFLISFFFLYFPRKSCEI